MSAHDLVDIKEAKDELSFNRSVYPKICANWFQQSLKTDLKTAMKFQVSTGNECNALKSSYRNSEDIEKIGLWRKVPVLYEGKNKQLKQNVNQISEAIDVISRIKATQQ
ncbi:hypothetical protein FOCC_FOCC015696 [Frankliniella occidentalis]|uniref:Uncharacterized protein LOC113204921 isoform X2 n=1 Tax=Frankliniella occidentalis TaxID=133901 RepID=A0A6J1SA07_FRAOC|nr:uncharacterized protein LOC113204921 isoform X2 [Frankliniella occidentalis]KAE8738797.1 hypothetical protein FOCC_FOCC015696 [Frankliniella occidentalis]